MNKEKRNIYNSTIKKLKYRAAYLCKHHYKKYIHRSYNTLMIENLMCNGRCHLVAVFKNYLIEDDMSDYLRRFYNYEESIPRLKKLFKFHQETSVIFPNYTPLIESKYLYNNVIRKQKIIDAQQDLEEKRNKSKSKKKSNQEHVGTDEKIFNSKIFGEILSPSESVLRIMFGIKKKEKKISRIDQDVPDNIDKINDKDDYNDSDIDKSEYIEMNNLIKNVEIAEENIKGINNNSLVDYKLNSNHVLKYKLKLMNSPNNNQMKNKNYEKLNSITNNSTNITSSSYINNNNPIKLQSNQNLKFKDGIMDSQKGKKYFNNKNSITINISDMKNKEKNFYINSYNNKNIISTSHTKNKSTIPNRTLYGSNFHINNNILSNLAKIEKRPISKHNSNSYSSNTSRLNINSHNNHTLNNNFPFNSKIYLLTSNNKITSSVKSNKLLANVPKIDMKKLKIINNSNKNNNNKIFTTTNRNINRNHNYILNNPNLFFGNTELLQSERNIIKKRNQKKDIIKNIMAPKINFSPSNSKPKNIFGDKKNNRKIVLINKLNLKSLNQYNNNLSIKILNKKQKKLLINENEYNTISKGNFSDRFNKKFIKTEF